MAISTGGSSIFHVRIIWLPPAQARNSLVGKINGRDPRRGKGKRKTPFCLLDASYDAPGDKSEVSTGATLMTPESKWKASEIHAKGHAQCRLPTRPTDWGSNKVRLRVGSPAGMRLPHLRAWRWRQTRARALTRFNGRREREARSGGMTLRVVAIRAATLRH